MHWRVIGQARIPLSVRDVSHDRNNSAPRHTRHADNVGEDSLPSTVVSDMPFQKVCCVYFLFVAWPRKRVLTRLFLYVNLSNHRRGFWMYSGWSHFVIFLGSPSQFSEDICCSLITLRLKNSVAHATAPTIRASPPRVKPARVSSTHEFLFYLFFSPRADRERHSEGDSNVRGDACALLHAA